MNNKLGVKEFILGFIVVFIGLALFYFYPLDKSIYTTILAGLSGGIGYIIGGLLLNTFGNDKEN